MVKNHAESHPSAGTQSSHTPVRTRRRFQKWDYPVFFVLTAVNIACVFSFVSYLLSFNDWTNHPLLFGTMFVLFVLNIGMWQVRWLFLPFMRVPEPMPVISGYRVGVATTFVPGAEALEMLEHTVKHLVAMEYPHDTWVLDEGDDDAVKALCKKYGALHFSRKNMPHYQTQSGVFEARSKHGNYNAWLYEIGFERYDIITAFDPDHVPTPEFLVNVLGYFADERVGYVQAAQAYYNQQGSFIARGAAEETYAYYSSIQMTSYALGYPIVTGCHNSHRVTALKEVGGFAAHEADDLLITILYRAAGWRGVYVPKILAKGLTPVDWSGYLKQQRRWARSVLDVKFRVYPKVARNLPRLERVISFLHGLYYLHGLALGAQIMVLGMMLITGVTPRAFSYPIIPQLVVLWAGVQLCEFYRQRFFLDVKSEWGLHWRARILEFGKWPYVLVAAVDALRRSYGPYTITLKVGASAKRYMLAIPHLIVVGMVVTAWIIGRMQGAIVNPLLNINTAMLVLVSVLVVLTEFFRFPDPYDSSLWPG